MTLQEEDATLADIGRHMARLAVIGIVVSFALALIPFGCWFFIPFLTLYAAGYRVVDGGTEWTDDIEQYLQAVEDHGK